MRVLGLDPGTANPGLALIERHAQRWTILRLPVLRSLDELLDELATIHHGGLDVHTCCVESVAWSVHAGAQGNGSGRILESVGALRVFARLRRVPVVEVGAQQWRKVVTGSAKATKEQCRAALTLRVGGWPPGRVSTNRSDAVAIALAGASMAGRVG